MQVRLPIIIYHPSRPRLSVFPRGAQLKVSYSLVRSHIEYDMIEKRIQAAKMRLQTCIGAKALGPWEHLACGSHGSSLPDVLLPAYRQTSVDVYSIYLR